MNRVKLGDVITLHRGYDLPESKRMSGDVPVISSAGPSGFHSVAKLNGENVITGRYGTIGDVFYHRGKCWPLNTTLYVSDFHGNCPRYTSYLLKAVLDAAKVDGRDKSTTPGVDRNVLHDIKVPFIKSLDEQKAIAGLLGAIDDKIELNKRVCDELEETAQLVYDYWFTQFDFPDENGKPYKSSGGKMVWNEELKREIPEGWKTARASDLFDLERGYSYSSGDLSEQDEVPFISLACFGRKLDYRSQELKHLKDGVRCSSWVKPNDMLIACTDLTRGADIIGCPIRVPDQFDKYAYSMDLAKVINLSRDVKRGYLYQSLRTNWFHKFAKGHTSGTNVIHLNLDVFKWFSLAIPPVELQERYDGICHNLFTLSDIELREDVELVATKDSLLPMLMNGQIKVSIASDASGTVDAKATS